MKNRVGRFQISALMVEFEPAAVLRIMGNVIVVRCEMLYAQRVFDYTALSEHFDEVGEGQEPPVYQPVTDLESGALVFERVRDFTMRVG